MHRHDALRRQQVVQHREDRLLHLAGVGRAADEDDAIGQVAGNDGFGAAAMAGRIGAEARQIDDGQLRQETFQGVTLGTNQQIADEERVPGEFGHYPRWQGVIRVGAADQVLNEKIAAFRMGQHVLMQHGEMFRRHRLVVVPPDLAVGIAVADDELVLGRTAGVLTGQRTKCTICCQLRLAATDRLFIKSRFQEVVANAGSLPQADFRDPRSRVPHAEFLHGPLSSHMGQNFE